ncbi:MAG: carboxypeptidase regulatory-like domain-containing protein [ANME-2 cluster archaeon]|nr:MAG: carboxypeptidase regulatory-like domain-containing protein [ANME-2 cluster archaeon]
MKNSIFVSVIFILLLLSGSAYAQETITIGGKVTSNGVLKPGLEVTLNTVVDEQITQISSTVTSSKGDYSFIVEPGTYLVNVTIGSNTYHNIVETINPRGDFDLSGTIEGQINHAQGKNVSGIPVSLVGSYNSVCETTVTDESGHFQFTHVNLAEHTIQARYMWVDYFSEKVFVNLTSVTANITIYDSTTKDNNIQVVTDHIIISQDMNGPWVQEYVKFMNMGNDTYYGPDGVYVGIGTPLEIKNLQTDVMDCCMVNEDRRVWVDPMEPMLPGDTAEATISYYLDTDDKEFAFEKDVLYSSMYLMVFGDADSGIDISSQSRVAEKESMNGKNYNVLRYPHPGRDDTITFTISGYTLPGKNNAGKKDWIIYLLLGVAIIGILAYPALSKAKLENSKTPEKRFRYPGIDEQYEMDVQGMSLEELETEKMRIFEKLRTLDYQFEDGQISEDEYDEHRSAYKASAVEIIHSLKQMELEEAEHFVSQLPFDSIDLSGTVEVIRSEIQEIEDLDILLSAIEKEKNDKNRKTLISALEKKIRDLKNNLKDI